jgi:hypothetical protein
MLSRSILLYISQNTHTSAVGLLRASPVVMVVAGVILAGFLPSVYAAPNSLPVVQIQQPSICSDRFLLGDIQVSGTATSNTSQIAKVEALIERASFSSSYHFQPATPKSDGDWSHWTITLRPSETGPHRILAHVVDKTGAESWDEIIVQINSDTLFSQPRQPGTRSVAVLEPMFTEAAYGSSDTEFGNFYAFYFKYSTVQPGTEIKSDLNLLNATIPREADHQFSSPLVDNLGSFDPAAKVTRINDMEVNDGYIFDKYGNNLYDAIFLLHDEYVTQQEYNNYEKFVKNGGTLVPLDGNIFYAQVTFDPQTCTVHFLKGHDWEFDGTGMHKGVSERFADENKKFLGSNFVINDISDPETYSNNLFNYSHFEENFLANPNATILIDYGAKIPKSTSSTENANSNPNSAVNPSPGGGIVPGDILGGLFGGSGPADTRKIATYELRPFGAEGGKVIMLGLYGQNLLHNGKFLRYLENVIYPIAFGDSRKIMVGSSGQSYDVHFKIPQRYNVTSVTLDQNSSSVDVKVSPVSNYVALDSNDTRLVAVFPKDLINADSNDGRSAFIVKIDGRSMQFLTDTDNIETSISLNVNSSSSNMQSSALFPHQISFVGTHVVPEFSSASLIMPIASIFAIALIVQRVLRTRKPVN